MLSFLDEGVYSQARKKYKYELWNVLQVNGQIAYASQEPWLFAGSVRQNILFGRKMDQHRYEQVVKVCQLKRDFRLLPYGDKTIVGERGISLSGGQRARYASSIIIGMKLHI